MSSAINLDQVLFSRSKWRLKLLVPCWIFQLLVLLCLMGIFAYRVVDTVEHYSHQENNNGQIPMVEIVYVSRKPLIALLALCRAIAVTSFADEQSSDGNPQMLPFPLSP